MSKFGTAAAEEADRILRLAGVDRWSAPRIRESLLENDGVRKQLSESLGRAERAAQKLLQAAEGGERAAEPDQEPAIENALTRVAQRARATAQAVSRIRLLITQEPSSEGVAAAEELYSLAASAETLLPKPLELPARMSIPESLRALGVLEALSKDWDADAVIGVNEGGSLVAQYLEHRLAPDDVDYGAVSFKQDHVDLTAAREVLGRRKVGRVLIVDDISRTGRTLREVHSALVGAYPKTRFECAALVSAVGVSAGSAKLYGYAAAITTDTRVSLPWLTRGTLTYDHDCYRFGAAGKSVPILTIQAEAIQRELREG